MDRFLIKVKELEEEWKRLKEELEKLEPEYPNYYHYLLNELDRTIVLSIAEIRRLINVIESQIIEFYIRR